MFENIKKQIPNTLTTLRLGMIGALPFLFMVGSPWLIIGTAALTLSTDFFDGYLARKWHVESEYGKKADVVADKIFGFGIMTLSAIFIDPIMLVPLILEGVNAGIGIANGIKQNKTYDKPSLIGRAKMFPLGITTVYSLLTMLAPSLTSGLYVLCGITALFQGTTAFVYAKRFVNSKKVDVLQEKIFTPIKDTDIKETNDKEEVVKNKTYKELIADLLRWRVLLELEKDSKNDLNISKGITKQLEPSHSTNKKDDN